MGRDPDRHREQTVGSAVEAPEDERRVIEPRFATSNEPVTTLRRSARVGVTQQRDRLLPEQALRPGRVDSLAAWREAA